MREIIRGRGVGGLILLAMITFSAQLLITAALSSQGSEKVQVRKVPARDTTEVSGSKLFHAYCAACHGQDGKGHGPAAAALKTAPPDLTLLARNNGGSFPADHVSNVVGSDEQYPAHGSKDMPVWGPIFNKMGTEQNMGRLRVHNLVDYLKSIQAK